MRFVALASLACTALASACLFPALDGLSGDGGGADVTSGDAPVVDAPSDVVADAAPGPFCPQDGALLCSDFDEVDAGFLGTWDFSYAPGTSTIEPSTAFWKSPPQSLLVATTGSDQSAGLSKQVSFTTGMVLSFDVYIVSLGGNPSICSFRIGSGGLSIQPHTTTTGLLESTTLADGGTSYDATSSTVLVPLDTWAHIDFDFDLPTHVITASINGQPLPRTLKNSDWFTATGVSVGLGVGSSAGETLYYDNATIRIR